jgi:hypothetical protein
MVRRILTYSALTALILLLAEVGIRVAEWRIPAERESSGDDLGSTRYGFGPQGYGDLVPRQNGHWQVSFHRPYHVQTNADGLRNTDDVAAQSRRILVVGSSFTFGPYVPNEETWPGWLEAKLRTIATSDRIQVLNAGVAGYRLNDIVELLRDKALGVRPDLVVLGISSTSAGDPLLPKRLAPGRSVSRSAETGVAALLRAALGQHSALYNLLSRLRRTAMLDQARTELAAGGLSPAPQPDPSEFRARMLEMKGLVDQAGAGLAVVWLPLAAAADGKDRGDFAVARDILSGMNIPLIDVSAALAAGDIEDNYLMQNGVDGRPVGDGHFSRHGNRIVGTYVAEQLRRHGLVTAAVIQ